MKFILLLIPFLISCQSFDGRDKPVVKNNYGESSPVLVKKYEDGIQLLDREDYKSAALHFESLISQYPTTPLSMGILFNLASAYEGLDNCKKAGRNFRKIVRTANEENYRIQAQALVRLSYAYECLNADKKVITSLVDAKGKEQYLRKATALAEIPARLGSAYGRIGKLELSKKLFSQADQGLYSLRDKTLTATKQRDQLARAMFFMGRYWFRGFHIKNHSNIVKTFENAQKYLLKAVELDSPTWSPNAAKNLVTVYDFFWSYLQQIHKDPRVGKYEVSPKEINSFAVLTLQSLNTLKAMKFPEKNPPPIVRSLMMSIDGFEKKFLDYLTQNNLGFSLSKAEQKRQSVRKNGITVNPDPRLEKMMKDMRKNKKLNVGPAE